MRRLKLLWLLTGMSVTLFAQTIGNKKSLVGTWIETTDTLEEIKIISPTHVFFIVRNLKADTIAYAGAGRYNIADGKYTENLQYANFELNKSGYTFDYKLEGDKFHQTGVVIFYDGREVPINHTFTRIKEDKKFNGAHVGTWNQLSSSFQFPDGSKNSHTNETHIRFQIFTPAHWMRISFAQNNFENAFAGTYTLKGTKMIAKTEYSSLPFKNSTLEIVQRIAGNKLYTSAIGKDKDGKIFIQFQDIFEKVPGPSKKSNIVSK